MNEVYIHANTPLRIIDAMPTVVIETHGCKLNMADSIAMAAQLQNGGFHVERDLIDSPDVFVLNSCTVTHVADKKARQRISRVRRDHPNTAIVMAGCYPTRDLDGVAALDAADLAVPNPNKSDIVDQVSKLLGFAETQATENRLSFNPAAVVGRTRAAVKIQEGCDQVCAYCIVPKVRGRERSVPATQLVQQINELWENGCQEVVLTGTQLGHYGFDLPSGTDNRLVAMLERVVKETEVPRIRVSSLQPTEIDLELLCLWVREGEGRLCPHLHIPLQSGSLSVSARMRRTYDPYDLAISAAIVRDVMPECSITTDIIAGFPGESEQDHEDSLSLMRHVQFADAHIFPYSRRPGTSAYHYKDQVDNATKSRRAAELRDLAAEHARSYRAREVGKARQVLWEGDGRTGLTENYLRVARSGTPAKDGEIETVRLTGANPDGTMECEPVGSG